MAPKYITLTFCLQYDNFMSNFLYRRGLCCSFPSFAIAFAEWQTKGLDRLRPTEQTQIITKEFQHERVARCIYRSLRNRDSL